MPGFLVLIDAETVSPEAAAGVLNFLDPFRQTAIVRAYANWPQEKRFAWDETTKRPDEIQKVEIFPGVGAVAVAMTMDAMHLAVPEIFERVVLVSGDTDFSRLAQSLQKKGHIVIGAGYAELQPLMREECSMFLPLDVLAVRAKTPGPTYPDLADEDDMPLEWQLLKNGAKEQISKEKTE